MKRLPSRFRRLDGALADLPVEEPMLLTELDGFLTGLVISPEPILSDEWMSVIWGPETDGIPPFDDPLDVQWFARAVAARHAEVARDLARGRLQPILDVDDRNGEVLWEYWIDGFSAAIDLRPEAWEALASDPNAMAPWSRLMTLLAVAREDSELDSVAINALQDRAAAELTETVQLLYVASKDRAATMTPTGTAMPAVAAKIGRNDPCPCGSGRKYKLCCS